MARFGGREIIYDYRRGGNAREETFIPRTRMRYILLLGYLHITF